VSRQYTNVQTVVVRHVCLVARDTAHELDTQEFLMLVVVYRITALRRELVTTHDDDCECRCYCVLSYLLLYFLCRRCSRLKTAKSLTSDAL
jgi:hypothetical protein